MFFLSKFSHRRFDWILFASVIFLTTIGLAAVYSVDLSRGSDLINFKKQLLACGLGLTIALVVSSFHFSWFRHTAKWWYWGSLALLVAVFFFGRSIRGTTGWFVVGGFSFQPVELAKVGVILLLAYIVANFGRRFDRPLFFFGTGFLVFLPMALVLKQPDLGSAVVLGIVWLGIMLLVRARRLYLLLLVGVMVAVALSGWFFWMKDYQKERLQTFVDPTHDPLGTGYNVSQSLIAIGSGKFFGRGLGFGSQSQLRFLPEAQTDFVFSVVGEELGFAGAASVVILFAVMLWRLVRIVQLSKDDFAAVTASGIAIMFFAHFFINIGADIGMLPVTGITLPFVSYGGSSLITNFLLIGIAEAMIVREY
ncbi:MAG: rod shape-determining protein RodA [Candidatus Magasanikbacteria bacterium]